MKLTRENAIFTFPTEGDLSTHVGRPISVSNFGAVAKVTLYDPNDVPAFGVLIHADAEQASVVPFHGGLAGTVKIKLLDESLIGNAMYAAHDGTFPGFALQQLETYSGTWDVCAIAMENGVAGEMVEAVLFRPEAVTIA